MNAPVLISEGPALGDIEDFKECCGFYAWFYEQGLISLQRAADNSQYLAERWGLVDEIGQGAVQAMIAEPFAIIRAEPEQAYLDAYAADYVARLVSKWEADDLKRPPRSEPRPLFRPKPPAASTVDAFKYVASLGDPDRLASWLRDHSDVAPALICEVA
jgi:hypothetical protein